jgi:hypothetical protein
LSGVQPHEEVETKWTTVCKLKNLPGVTFDSTSYTIVVDKEEFKHHLMVSFVYRFFVQHVQTTMVHSTKQMSSHCKKFPKDDELMNKPNINYRQMKHIFDQPAHVNWKKVYSTSNLIAAIDYLADNKADGTTFARMTPTDKKIWLRTWLCNMLSSPIL